MKVHDSSSQTIFLSRHSLFFTGSSPANGHVFSSRTPALRAASAEPSAVRPYGLLDSRDSFAETTTVSNGVSVDEKRSAERRWRRWQDKAVREDGSGASSQPAPVTEVARSGLSDTVSDRSQNDHLGSGIKEHASVWMKPGVKSAMQHLATGAKVSFSSACDTGLEVYARAKIRDQEETLFEPRMQAMMRREIRASDKRHLYFEMCNAVAAEQTRIYTADLYKRVLLKEGIPLKEINKKLDNAYTMARNNILRKAKTPQLKNLFDAWWQSTEDLPDGTGEAGKPES
jgi:hypothetical protein